MATTSKFNGSLMLLYIDGVAVAHSTNVSLTGETAEIDTTTKDSTGYTERLMGLKNWNVSCDFLAVVVPTTGNLEVVYDAWVNRTQVHVDISTEISGDVYFNGDAYINGFNLDTPMEDKASGSFTLVGDGSLTLAAKT